MSPINYRKRKKILAGLALSVVFLSTTAGATTTVATVSQILLLGAGANLVYVYPTGGIAGGPSCAAGQGAAYYSFSYTRTMGPAYLAALLTAQASGATVVLFGTSACTDQSVSETLNYFIIN